MNKWEGCDDPATFEELGLWTGVPFDVYKTWPGLNKSKLWLAWEATLLEYRYAVDHPDDSDNKAFRIGHASHTSVLEPEHFGEFYARTPDPPEGSDKWNRRTKAHKEAWNQFLASSEGRIVLAPDEWDTMVAMCASVRSHPDAAKLLEISDKEVSFQWRDPSSGILLKGRADIWANDIRALADLKFVREVNPGQFGNQAYRNGYHFQLAMYSDGIKVAAGVEPKPPVLIGICKSPPHVVAMYQMDPNQLELGRAQYHFALDRVTECDKEGRWPGYDGVMDLVFPSWAGCELGA